MRRLCLTNHLRRASTVAALRRCAFQPITCTQRVALSKPSAAPEQDQGNFAASFDLVCRERQLTLFSSDYDNAQSSSRLLDTLFPERDSSAAAAPRRFLQHLFPNLESAKLVLEKHREDGIFDAVFRRHDALLQRQAAAAVEEGKGQGGGESTTVLVHPLLRERAMDTAMDAARVLPALIVEAAAATVAVGASKRHEEGAVGAAGEPKTVARLLDDETFIQALCEQVFLSAFFTMEPREDARGAHPRRAELLAALRSHAHEAALRSVPSLLVEAMEVCIARLLLASPFSFHVAFEYLLRQRRLGPQPHVPLTLFRLWWIVNPDQVPFELSGAPGRPLPSLLDPLSNRFCEGSPDGARCTAGRAQRRERTAAYREGVMTRLLAAAREAPARKKSLGWLTPELFYPHQREAVYMAALQEAARAAWASGEAKYSVSCPLIPRVVQVAAAASAREPRSQRSEGAVPAIASLLFVKSVVPLACETALEPAAEMESWLVLWGLATAVGLLNGHAAKLRRLPRRGKSAKSPTSDGMGYEEHLDSLREAFALFVREMLASVVVAPCGQRAAEGEASRSHDWACMLFNTVSSSFEFSGAFSPSATHRPLTMSDMWRRLHRQALLKYPHVFHAGSRAVATLFTLSAMEGVSTTAEGRMAAGLASTSLARETAMAAWRQSFSVCGGGDEVGDGSSQLGWRRASAKRVHHVLTRAMSVSSSGSAAAEQDGREEETRWGSRASLPPVDHAAKDIQYPPHPFVSGCGEPSAPLAHRRGPHGNRQRLRVRDHLSLSGGTAEALLDQRSAVLSIAREHVSLPLLREGEGEGRLRGQRDVSLAAASRAEASEAAAAARLARGQPSFFVLLKALQVLSTIGEPGGQTREAVGDNMVAECVAKEVCPAAQRVVGTFCGKLAVQSLLHSTTAAGAVPLITKYRKLLDCYPASLAWEKLVVTLLWSGLPANETTRALLLADEAHASDRSATWQPAFGSGSLAWSVMRNNLGSPPAPGVNDTDATATTELDTTQNAHKCVTLALDHLLALACQIPEDAPRPSLVACFFDRRDVQEWARAASVSLTGAGGTDESGMEHALPQAQEGAVSDQTPDADDFNDYEYLFGEEGGSADTAMGEEEGEEKAAGDRVAAAFQDEACELPGNDSHDGALSPLPTDEGATLNLPLSDPPGANDAEEAALLTDLQKTLAGSPPAAQHLYLSWLEILGAAALSASPAARASPPPKLACVAVGYEVLRKAAQHPLVAKEEGEKETADADVSPWRISAALTHLVARPGTLTKLILFHVHTVPDVLLLAHMVLRLARVRCCSAAPGVLLLPMRVVSSLCQLLCHAGVDQGNVRRWRSQTPSLASYACVMARAAEGPSVVEAHEAALAGIRTLLLLPSSPAEARAALLYLLGSLVLEALSPTSVTRFHPVAFDTRDVYITAFMASARQPVSTGHGGVDGKEEKGEAAVGVVLPSQQLVSFATAAGADVPQRAQTWAEVKRRLLRDGEPAASSLPLAPGAREATMQIAVDTLHTDAFTDLFTQ